MRRSLSLLLIATVLFLLSACAEPQSTVSQAVEFRAALVNAGGCIFRAEVMADFGDAVQSFSLECSADAEGRTQLTVIDPESIAGITATVTDAAGTITYDGMAMDFGLLADGQVIPAAAPALTVDCWLNAYIAAAGDEDGRYRVTYEKGYDEKVLTVDTWFENGLPISADVCYNQQRILRLTLTDFSYQQQ